MSLTRHRSCSTIAKRMKECWRALILVTAVLVVAGCSTVKEKNDDPFGLNLYLDQVDLCYILGVQYDEFETFMEEKGIRTFGQGNEAYIVTVHRSKKEKALQIIQKYDLRKRFHLDLNIQDSSDAIQSR